MIPEDWAESPPLLLLHERPSSCCTCRIPMVPILQIHTQIPPIQISSLCYQLCQLFIILTYTEVQTQDHGAGGRPVDSPTTIHSNIPSITVTVLDMEL